MAAVKEEPSQESVFDPRGPGEVVQGDVALDGPPPAADLTLL
jgi:hypothetical protein